MGETVLMRTIFGSHVYGTSVPTSDTDIKEVYLPTAKDILLQLAKGTTQDNTKKDSKEKNTAEDVDIERFSLHRYLQLLLEGQTVALDVLFTPESAHQVEAHAIWKYLQRNRQKFLHSGAASFAGYCRTQAAKYGIKGSRVGDVRSAVSFFKKLAEKHGETARLRDHWEQIVSFAKKREHTKITDCKGPKGEMVPHFECCDRLTPLHSSFKRAIDLYQNVLDEYGTRALQAESNEGIDWKALGHAVRVCAEAKELLVTGNVTFPRPEKDLLLRIRKGEMPYKEVATLIEDGLLDLEKCSASSVLQKTPDRAFSEELVCRAYANEVIKEYGHFSFEENDT